MKNVQEKWKQEMVLYSVASDTGLLQGQSEVVLG